MSKKYLDLFFEEILSGEDYEKSFECDDMLSFFQSKGLIEDKFICCKYDDDNVIDCKQCINLMSKKLKEECGNPLLSKEDYELLKEFSNLKTVQRHTKIIVKRIQCINGKYGTAVALCNSLYQFAVEVELEGDRFTYLKKGELYVIQDLLDKGYYDYD